MTGEPYGGRNLWQITEGLDGRVDKLERRQDVIETRLSAIERTQGRIIAMSISIMVAVIASGVGTVLTIVLTRKT